MKQPRLCFTSNHLDKLQTTNLTQFAIYDMAYDLRHRVIIQFSTRVDIKSFNINCQVSEVKQGVSIYIVFGMLNKFICKTFHGQ